MRETNDTAGRSELRVARVGDYRFGFTHSLTTEQLSALALLLSEVPKRERMPLGGRGGVAIQKVDGLGSIAVKRYLRGGVMRFLNSRYYLRIGRVRPQVEFELLEQVRCLGVEAPEPIAFATRGALCYEGWLLMREIAEHGRLAETSVLERFGPEKLINDLARQVRILIENKVLHVDLHPGNVLVDQSGRVHVVDFDNAAAFDGSERDLRDQYLRRWRRAVIKHSLPETLSELMAMELRQVAAQGC